jgi:hypothetical protein
MTMLLRDLGPCVISLPGGFLLPSGIAEMREAVSISETSIFFYEESPRSLSFLYRYENLKSHFLAYIGLVGYHLLMIYFVTERSGRAVNNFCFVFGRSRVLISTWTPAILTEIFHDFLQSLLAKILSLWKKDIYLCSKTQSLQKLLHSFVLLSVRPHETLRNRWNYSYDILCWRIVWLIIDPLQFSLVRSDSFNDFFT